jgi:hypothetical protein
VLDLNFTPISSIPEPETVGLLYAGLALAVLYKAARRA